MRSRILNKLCENYQLVEWKTEIRAQVKSNWSGSKRHLESLGEKKKSWLLKKSCMADGCKPHHLTPVKCFHGMSNFGVAVISQPNLWDAENITRDRFWKVFFFFKLYSVSCEVFQAQYLFYYIKQWEMMISAPHLKIKKYRSLPIHVHNRDNSYVDHCRTNNPGCLSQLSICVHTYLLSSYRRFFAVSQCCCCHY